MHTVTRRGFLFGSAGVAAIFAGLGMGLGMTGCSSSTAPNTKEAYVPGPETQYYKSGYEYTQEAEEKLSADQHELYRQIIGEGTVLLKNEGDALPLYPSDGKVMVFGNAGPQYLKGLDGCFKDAGFDFDDACWTFYSNGTTNVTNVAVNENPWSSVEAAGFLGAASGVAIVVIGRRGREGSDNRSAEGADYLKLSDEEKQMLSGVAALRRSGTFSKMVILFTLSNTPSWEDGEWSDAIDAVVWAGSYDDPYFSRHQPDYSTGALLEVLEGAFNPSGRLPDSIYKDNHLNPVMANFGVIDADLSHLAAGKADEVQHEIDRWMPGMSKDKGSHWRRNYVYAEGIYVGYRYYETRYEDKVLGQGNAGDFDYSAYVAYPFGYGLSYTDFVYSSLALSETDDGFDISVDVANEGGRAGKHAVTVYVQSPYTDYDRKNGIEKASVALVGYAKSGMIESGSSETVTVHVDKRRIASYDSNAARTYILDAGDYYFAVGNGSHEAMNNILAAKGKTTGNGMTEEGNPDLAVAWSNAALDAETFATSPAGAKIQNLFDDVDPNKNEMMKELDSVTWLTRSDWTGTLPAEAIHLVYTDEVADMAKPVSYQAGSGDASSVPSHKFGQKGSLVLVDMREKGYDDKDWESLVSKLSYEEMVSLICNDQTELDSIGKPNTTNADGSNGRSAVFAESGITGIPYPMTAWRAATFNTDLNSQVGSMIGENLLHAAGVERKGVGLYGFSCNIHRAPYSGRNYEYYSEDPFLSGEAIAHEVKGFVDKGGITYMKHFAANDQETFRHGVPSWSNEQALREIYLEPFAMAMTEGGANGIMSGFNRLGMHWTGSSPALLRDFAETECGYKGITLTDAFETDYMNTIDGLLNGTHAWLGGTGYINTDAVLLQDDYRNDPIIQDAVFNAVHRILYVNAHSLAMNSLKHDYVFGSKGPEHPYADKTLMVSGVPIAGASMLAPTFKADFYTDGTFGGALAGFFGTTALPGTWTYDDESGLQVVLSDGTDLAIADDNGIYRWTYESASSFGPQTSAGAVSQYEFVEACNKANGTSYKVPAEPTFKVTYAAGSDKVAGTDPASATVKTGETFTLPENPYKGTYQVFAGWSVNGETKQPGDEIAVSGYVDYAIEGTWTDEPVATATTQDTYKYSFIQQPSVPMVLYCDGRVGLQRFRLVSCSGTWQVAGSGSGRGTLSILNESGQLVNAAVVDGAITYVQEGFYYDWGTPDIGYGSGFFRTAYTHRIPVEDFVKSYNEIFGTSYSDMDVQTGTAAFAEVDDPAAPTISSLW